MARGGRQGGPGRPRARLRAWAGLLDRTGARAARSQGGARGILLSWELIEFPCENTQWHSSALGLNLTTLQLTAWNSGKPFQNLQGQQRIRANPRRTVGNPSKTFQKPQGHPSRTAENPSKPRGNCNYFSAFGAPVFNLRTETLCLKLHF